MLMDNHGNSYAAFLFKSYASLLNTSQSFVQQRFHEEPALNESFGRWPFTFVLDQNGTIWMVVVDEIQPKYTLLKAAVSADSYIVEESRRRSHSHIRIPTRTKSDQKFIIIMTTYCTVVMLGFMIFLLLKVKRENTPLQNTSEAQKTSIFRDNGAIEGQYRVVDDVQAIATPPSAILLIISPRSAGRRKATPRTSKKPGEASRDTVENNNDSGPGQQEPLCEYVAPAPSRSPGGEDATTSESLQCLKILP
ncbi:uncharacterized protein LOC135937692 [Cloeon dipterum]|uniref:uncharacterized protein LOC135937692 n=1 Tax=Cloeon dipterum TaxID=197152 RepID=UPI00321FD47B